MGIADTLLRLNQQRMDLSQAVSPLLRRPGISSFTEVFSQGTMARSLATNMRAAMQRMFQTAGTSVGDAMIRSGLMPRMGAAVSKAFMPGGAAFGVAAAAAKVILPVGIALAVVGSAAYVAVKGLMMVRDTMRGLTDELRDISPQVALGEAQAQLIRLKSQLEANAAVGGLLGKQVNVQARLDAAIMKFKVTTVEALGPLVNMAMEGMVRIVESFVAGMREILDAIGGPGGLMASIGTFIKSVYSSPIVKALALFNPALSAVAGPMVMLGESLERIGRDVSQIKRNTQQELAGEANEPFLQDLRIMGVPI